MSGSDAAGRPAGQPAGGPDEMRCRSCGRMERASEGYPCAGCGTFLCVGCELRGVTLCRPCAAPAPPVLPPPMLAPAPPVPPLPPRPS